MDDFKRSNSAFNGSSPQSIVDCHCGVLQELKHHCLPEGVTVHLVIESTVQQLGEWSWCFCDFCSVSGFGLICHVLFLTYSTTGYPLSQLTVMNKKHSQCRDNKLCLNTGSSTFNNCLGHFFPSQTSNENSPPLMLINQKARMYIWAGKPGIGAGR